MVLIDMLHDLFRISIHFRMRPCYISCQLVPLLVSSSATCACGQCFLSWTSANSTPSYLQIPQMLLAVCLPSTGTMFLMDMWMSTPLVVPLHLHMRVIMLHNSLRQCVFHHIIYAHISIHSKQRITDLNIVDWACAYVRTHVCTNVRMYILQLFTL